MRELNAKGKNPNTDDAVYASDEEIRRRVPRGLSLMQIDDPISGFGEHTNLEQSKLS